VSRQFGFNDDSRSISEHVVPQAQSQGVDSVVSTRMLVGLFSDDVSLSARTIAQRSVTEFTVYVSFRDEVVSAAKKEKVIINVIKVWVSGVLYLCRR
jgi:hypothetical protein